MQKGGVSMSYLQRKNHGKEQAEAPDWGFVAFVIVIFAIAVTLTLTQIYLQNPK
jgi:hypothetical protein